MLAGVAGCLYDPPFADCHISCTSTTGCPSGFSCLSEGLCRADGETELCGDGAPIQWVSTVAQRIHSTASDSFSVGVEAGHAVVMQVGCSGSAAPSAVAVSAPGWNLMPIEPLLFSQGVSEATYGATVPSATPTTVTVTWTGSTCESGNAVLADEFANTDPRGGAFTFDKHVQTAGTGSGACNATVETGSPNEAVWAACLANVAGAGSGYTLAGNDGNNDESEYKVTTDPANTSELVTFSNATPYLVSVVTLRPQ